MEKKNPQTATSVFYNSSLFDDYFFRCVNSHFKEIGKLVILPFLKDEEGIVEFDTEVECLFPAAHGVRFDVVASLTNGDIVAFEFQKNREKVSEARVEYYLSALTTSLASKSIPLEIGEDYERMRNVRLCFITAGDWMKTGVCDSCVVPILEPGGVLWKGKQSIRLLNYSKSDTSSKLGKGLHDLFARNPEEIINPELKNIIKMIKSPQEGNEYLRSFLSMFPEIEDESYNIGYGIGETVGLDKGRKLGLAEGREEGRVEGRAKGRAEGRKEGRAEGRKEGREEGRAEERIDLLSRAYHEGLMTLSSIAKLLCLSEEEAKTFLGL